MCIILDTNTWSAVFDDSTEKHPEFKPVRDWIMGENGVGRIVYGGTTYLNETPPKYRRLLKLLTDAKRTIPLSLETVDDEEIKLKTKKVHRDFDDPHIVAMVIVSKCRLICTQEERAIPFFKDEERILYPKRFPKPKIYHHSGNVDLLTERNIPKKYLPIHKLSKKEAKKLESYL
jgi:predicted nucleic acid-binding protein